MKTLDSLFRCCDSIVRAAAGIALIIMTVVLFINAVARYFADFAIIGSEELSRYLMVWMTFLGSYVLVRVQRHITVDVFARLVPAAVSRVIQLCCAVVGAITLGYVAYLGWDLATFVMNSGQMSSSLPIRRGWVYFAIPIGCGLMALAYVFELLVAIFGGSLPRGGDYGLPDDIPEEGEHDPSMTPSKA